jgi:hypothetical protein
VSAPHDPAIWQRVGERCGKHFSQIAFGIGCELRRAAVSVFRQIEYDLCIHNGGDCIRLGAVTQCRVIEARILAPLPQPLRQRVQLVYVIGRAVARETREREAALFCFAELLRT